jgi:hypothetical protein
MANARRVGHESERKIELGLGRLLKFLIQRETASSHLARIEI